MKATDSRHSSSLVHPFATVDVFGLPFIDAAHESHVAEHLASAGPFPDQQDRLPIVFTPNVDILVQLESDRASGLGARLAKSAYVLPDGAPIVWAARAAHRPLQARLAGSTVFSHLWPRLAEERRRVAVLCSTAEVKAGLEAEHPCADVQVAPIIAPIDADIVPVAEALIATAIEIDAEFCLLCIGHPKDSLIALAAVERWPEGRQVPLILCLGASAEFHLGIKRRAPQWAQRYGLEWMVRFLHEPRRMFSRYFVRDLAFVPMALREIRRGRQETRASDRRSDLSDRCVPTDSECRQMRGKA